MKLSLLPFSFMGDVMRRMGAETLCWIAKENVIEEQSYQITGR